MKRPKQALERINTTVNRMGLNELPVMLRYEKLSMQNGSELGKLFAGQLGFQKLYL